MAFIICDCSKTVCIKIFRKSNNGLKTSLFVVSYPSSYTPPFLGMVALSSEKRLLASYRVFCPSVSGGLQLNVFS